MSSNGLRAVRQWLVLAAVLAVASFLFWPRSATDCTVYGPARAVDQSMYSAMANRGVACQR